MPRRLALIPYAFSESVTPANPLGLRPRILERGWEAFYSERESSDAPCVDDALAAGWGVYGSRVAGCFGPGDQTLCIGHYHDAFGGAPLFPEPRGPGAFTGGQFHDLEGFIAATRIRTDRAKRLGVDFGAYMTLPRWDALNDVAHEDKFKLLDKWTRTIRDAGFTRVGGDMAPGTAQKPGEETAGLRWAEHLVWEGIEFDGETFERCTPTAFAWANGRFGVIASPESRERREGWIGESTEGCYTRKFLWLQGHIPPAERRAMTEAETKMDVIVDCAGTGMIPTTAPTP